MKYEDKLPENIGLGITIGIATGALVFIEIAWLLWQIPFPFKMYSFEAHLYGWSAMMINQIVPELFQSSAEHYKQYLGNLSPSVSPFVFTSRFYFAAITGLISGSLAGYMIGKPKSAIAHVGGRELHENAAAVSSLKSQAKTECNMSGEGIKLHPSFPWNFSLHREKQHLMIAGKSGSGKTQIIIPIISAAIERGDQLVIYDNKGDFSRWVENAIQLAPWHQGSLAIDIAKDCTNTQGARELATRLIPAGHDPMWHQAARLVLVAILIKLQKQMPRKWTWGDLLEHVCKSQEELVEIIKEHSPEARHVIEAPGKTTQSILINFSTNMSLIADLAAAWGKAPEDKRISITEWIKTPQSDRKVLILQGSENYKELSDAYIHIVLDMMSSLINSPNLPESSERKIYFILDEFPQLGKLTKFKALLEIGRSKGVRVVMAFQDISQLRAIYDEHVTNSWLGLVSTLIFTQLGIGDTANFVAEKLIGYKTIDRVVMDKGQPNAPVREKVLVINPHELNENLGITRRGINALILGYKDAHIIEWPYTKVNNLRNAYIPASWLEHPENVDVKDAVGFSNISNTSEVNAPVANVSVTGGAPAKLKLRKQLADEILCMAESGTNISDAAEPIAEVIASDLGGNNETR